MGKTNTNWNIVNQFAKDAKKVNCKEHFRLKKYGVTIKEIGKVRYTRTCKYNINYHFVWIPKTRMKILVPPFSDDIEGILVGVCDEYEFAPLALEIMPDHIHFFVSAPPKYAPSFIIQKLKGTSSREIRKKYHTIRATRSSEDFWASGYYVGTAGHVSAVQVARYISEQTENLKGKWNLFDIKPFEYDINDPSILQKDQTLLCSFGA